MPNAKVLSEKQAIVESLSEKLKNAAAGVIVDYKGITVAEDTELRKACRENEVEYAVIKNTMLRRAFNNVGFEALDDQLNGTTSLAIAADPVAPARVIAEFAKKLNDKFEIKGGFMDGKVIELPRFDPGSARSSGAGARHDARAHHGLGRRPEADRRKAGCPCRGFRRGSCSRRGVIAVHQPTKQNSNQEELYHV